MNLRKLGRMSGIVAAIAMLAMALQGCGGDDGEVDQSLYDQVVNEREAALAAQEAAEAAAAEAQAEAEAAEAAAAEAQAEAEAAKEAAAEAQAEAAAASAVAEAAAADKAVAEAAAAEAQARIVVAEAAQAEAEAAQAEAEAAQAEAEAAQAEAEAAQAEAEAAAAAAQEAAQAQMEQDAEAARLARLARVNAKAIMNSATQYDHDEDGDENSPTPPLSSVSEGFQGDIHLPGDTNMDRVDDASEDWLTLTATRAGSVVTFKATADNADDPVFEFDATAGAAGMTEVDMPGGRTRHIHLMSDIEDVSSAGITFADYAALEAGLVTSDFDPGRQETSYRVLFDGNDKINANFPIPTVEHTEVSLPQGSERIGTYDGVPGVYRCSAARCVFMLQADGTVIQPGNNFYFIPAEDADNIPGLPDADYLVYGAWLTVPDSVAGVADAAAIAAGSDLFTGSSIDGLTGEAAYEGSAAGFYADRPVDSDAAVSGTFTATATLNADFGADNEAGTLEGKITDFVRDDGAEVDWMVTLDAVTLGNADDGGFASGMTGGLAGGAPWDKGEWGVQIVGNASDARQHPSGVVGTFGAERGEPDPETDPTETDIGFTGVIGGFGARN